MKRLSLLLLTSLWLASCGWVTHPVDYTSRNYGKLDKAPQVIVRLSTAPQVCARANGTASVVLFVNLLNLPPQPIRIVVNGQLAFFYDGLEASLALQKVGLGNHYAEVFVDGYREAPFRVSWSVWYCQ